METKTKETVGGSGWGEHKKGQRITDIADLHPSQIYLEYNPQFNAKNVVKITSGDKTDMKRAICYGVFVDPTDHTQHRGGSVEFAIWDFELKSTEFYAIVMGDWS